jgi:hypothetical protein
VTSNQQSNEARKITPSALKFDEASSTAVISSAQKFILPVPAFGQGGEPLVYPEGDPKAGKQILDYEGKTIGERGLVFFNAKDKSWQAVQGDGSGVVIINEVTKDQADRLHAKIREFQQDPRKLTLDQFKRVLDYARNDLSLGDMYNSTVSFIKSKMTPVSESDTPHTSGAEVEAFGLMKRDDRDVCQAVYIPGRFVFEGPAVTPQVFENGGVIVRQGNEFRGVQPDIFARTYRLANGNPVASVATDLKSQAN